MSKAAGVTDPELRTLLERAQMEMREGKASESVHTCSDAFLRLISLKPEFLAATLPGRTGQSIRQVMMWPRLGANLSLESVEAGKPEIKFERERFATSEAIMYYEFAVDTALRLGA